MLDLLTKKNSAISFLLFFLLIFNMTSVVYGEDNNVLISKYKDVVLRAEANEYVAKTLSNVNKGDRVPIENIGNGWVKTIYNGEDGYIKIDDLKGYDLNLKAEISEENIVLRRGILSFFKGPVNLEKDNIVTILNIKGKKAKVRYESQVGYIDSRYLRYPILEESVEIDIPMNEYPINENEIKNDNEVNTSVANSNDYLNNEKNKTTKGQITVKYIEQGTGQELSETLIKKDLDFGSYNFEALKIDGYVLNGKNEEEIEIDEDDNNRELIFLYNKIENKGSLIVEFVDAKTGEIISDTKYYSDLNLGEFEYKAQEIEGYTIVESESKNVNLSDNDLTDKIIYMYVENEENNDLGKVTINYIEKSTGNQIEQEIKKDLILQEHIFNAKDIKGYKVVGDESKKVNLTKENREQIVIFEYEKDSNTGEVNKDEVPYIATVYTNPDLDINDDVILKFYATDFNHSEYMEDNKETEFKVLLNLNGIVKEYRKQIGESTLNLGKLPVGEYWYTIQVIDEYERKSPEIFGEFRVIDKEKREAEINANTHYVTDEELTTYGISKYNDSSKAHDTKVGLQNLINDLASEGVRKCILPLGTYRIDSEYDQIGEVQRVKNVIRVPSNFIFDLNGSTIKQDTTPQVQNVAFMITIDNAYDGHVINGIFEGDYGERDLTPQPNGYPSAEGVSCGSISGGSKYSSFDNLTVKKFPGYAMTVGLGLKSRHAILNGGLENWTAIEISDEGKEISSGNKFTSDYFDLSKFEEVDTIRSGKYLGYQFSQDGDDWVVNYHFYDGDRNYIKSSVGYQYRPIVKPKEAKYVRTTYTSKDVTKLNALTIYHIFTPVNSAIRNIAFEDTRTCALNPNQGNNIVIEGCTFKRCATNITPCAIDFEDGWNLMQDYCVRNNEVLEAVGTADIVAPAGLNLQIVENENFRIARGKCQPGLVVRNNNNITLAGPVSTRVNSGYYRFDNNKFRLTVSRYIPGGNEATAIPLLIKDSTFFETDAAGDKFTEYRRCNFDWNNKKLDVAKPLIGGYFNDCTFKNYKDPNKLMHLKNLTFINGEMENVDVFLQGNLIIKNSEIKNMALRNYTVDMNILLENSKFNNLTIDRVAWAKCAFTFDAKNCTFDNDNRKNIFDDGFQYIGNEKTYKFITKNNIYLNDTYIAGEKVLSNPNIDISEMY